MKATLKHPHTSHIHTVFFIIWSLACCCSSAVNKSMKLPHSEVQGAMETVCVGPTQVTLLLWKRIQFMSFLCLVWRQSLCWCARDCLCVHPMAAPHNMRLGSCPQIHILLPGAQSAPAWAILIFNGKNSCPSSVYQVWRGKLNAFLRGIYPQQSGDDSSASWVPSKQPVSVFQTNAGLGNGRRDTWFI